jgi:hypothetical protein
MTLRSSVYIVPTHRWYIERTVWFIAGSSISKHNYGIVGGPAVDLRGDRYRIGFH